MPLTLTDYWNNQGHFALDAVDVGATFGFTYSSMLWQGQEIWAYFIGPGTAPKPAVNLAVSRARSKDGLAWNNDGRVLDVGGGWQDPWVFSVQRLDHEIGRNDGDGWSANVAQDNPGYLCHGPRTNTIPGGANTCSFRLMVDNTTASNDGIVTLDVYDAQDQRVLASSNVNRHDFDQPFVYKLFNVKISLAQTDIL